MASQFCYRENSAAGRLFSTLRASWPVTSFLLKSFVADRIFSALRASWQVACFLGFFGVG